MKVSLSWLRELTGLASLTADDAARALTNAGLEVEGITRLGNFSGVVVAEVRGKRPHPDATRLTLVDVFDGSSVTQVVCGAPNVPDVGWKVLWARPGARLPMGEGGAPLELDSKVVRGIESPGMLCAEDELGLGESHAGIITIAPSDALAPGTDAAAALGYPDEILELNVTPNRSDCLGHVGVARELIAVTRSKERLHRPSSKLLEKSGDVRVRIGDGCTRYCAIVIEGVTVADSRLKTRLELASLGVRAISNVVDVTNIVLLSHGQPLHAFDLDKLPGAEIIVRRAKAGETLETLDGVTRELVPTDVLVCDGADRPIALAGVMGGKATEVTASTKRVLLEIASFDANAIRATAKRLGLQSEASHRFERGVDPNAVAIAADIAATAMVRDAGGTRSAVLDVYPAKVEPTSLTLRAARTRRVTGLHLEVGRQAELLRSLDLDVEIAGDMLNVLVPTFRPDLTREIDLIEEVLRLEGYDKVPLTIPALRAAPPELKHRVADRARDLMNALGFDEAITYAFVSPRDLAALELASPRDRLVRIANPLREEQSAMRTSLVTGLVRAAARNVAHGVGDVRLFEIGHTFVKQGSSNELPLEQRHVAAIWLGARDGWLKAGEPVDYFDLRGVVDELARGLSHTFDVVASREPWLHPGVQGALSLDGQVVGWLGELHPKVAAALALHVRALVFELSLSALPKPAAMALRAIPRFPAVVRDASFLVEVDRSSAEILRAVEALAIPLLAEAAPLEDYRDPAHVPVGQKSMLWSFTYRAADRTLTDAEVKKAHEGLVAALSATIGARLR